MVEIAPCTGIDDNIADKALISLYPNPTNGDFHLNCPSDVNVVIYDLLGRVVFEKQLPEGANRISIPYAPAGKYLVKTTSEKKQQTFILIKQ
jgi:hypothetical protein